LQERKTRRLEGLSGKRLLKVARESCSKKPPFGGTTAAAKEPLFL